MAMAAARWGSFSLSVSRERLSKSLCVTAGVKLGSKPLRAARIGVRDGVDPSLGDGEANFF
jgi:hypothetical protein